MAVTKEDVILVIVLLQVFFVDECQAYRYSYPWWSMWYFWVVLFAVLACCFGAGGSYYRKRMLARAGTGQRPVVVSPQGQVQPTQPYVTGYNSTMPSSVIPAPYPVGPTQPPQYSEVSENNEKNLPPSYADLYGKGQQTQQYGTGNDVTQQQH